MYIRLANKLGDGKRLEYSFSQVKTATESIRHLKKGG